MGTKPINLGRLLEKTVVGVAITDLNDIRGWSIGNEPKIVVWDCSKRLPRDAILSLFHFWLDHGARTFVFGGRYGYQAEDAIIERLETLQMDCRFNDLVLTSNSLSLPDAVWCGGFTGYVDTPQGEEPLVCIMRFGSVSKLSEARDWVQRIQGGWIPEG